MPPERIVALPSVENFWSVGGPGPCGPDSEIYWDWGAEHGCGEPTASRAARAASASSSSGTSSSWSSSCTPDGAVTPLPKQNIDTGMGLERTAAILQDVDRSTRPTGTSRSWAGSRPRRGVAYGDSADATKAHRVLADHGRGMTFLVGDGVIPSNEGRGYVLRRIIRRAVQHGRRIGMSSPFSRAAATVIEQMGGAYPELGEHPERSATRCGRGGALQRDDRARACGSSTRLAARTRSAARTPSRWPRPTASRSS